MAGFADFRGYMPTSADAVPPPPEFAPPPGYFGSGRVHPRPTVVIPPVMLTGSQGDSGRGCQARTVRREAEEGRRGAYVDVGGNPNLFTASERPPSPVDEEEEERMMKRLATWRGE